MGTRLLQVFFVYSCTAVDKISSDLEHRALNLVTGRERNICYFFYKRLALSRKRYKTLTWSWDASSDHYVICIIISNVLNLELELFEFIPFVVTKAYSKTTKAEKWSGRTK